MKHVLRSRAIALFATLALVVIGTASAHSMAPDRDQMAREATLLIMGASLADICENGATLHAHDCPLCHKLPSPPEVHAPETPRAVAFWDGYPGSDDLLSGPTGLTRDGAPRAPPLQV